MPHLFVRGGGCERAEMGGVHFSLTLFWAQLTTIASAVLYQHYVPSPSSSPKLSAPFLYSFVVTLAVTWLLSFVLFLKLINPEYITTFFTTKTGVQYSIALFRNGNDRTKAGILDTQKRQWSSIRSEVLAWTTENWTRWEEEKPDWFNELFVSTLPDEFKKDRRRSSLLGSGRGDGGRGEGKANAKNRGGGGIDTARLKQYPSSGD